MLRIGLTGGICAGKSTVAGLFHALGVPIVDADELAHELVRPGMPALQQIVARFGERVLNADGSLDRKLLREHVFADPAERRALEEILHPAIREVTRQRLQALEQTATPYAINAVPLLIETGLAGTFDRILVIDVPEQVQERRLMERDGIDAAQARRILQAQASRKARLEAADDVISNDGSQAQLSAEVQRVHARYLELAAATPGRLGL